MIRGVAWNIIGMVAVALTMLVTIPLFLDHFGAQRYGILATIWVFFGYFSVLDFGMGPALVNFLSRDDRQTGEAASSVFWTAFIVNAGIGIVVAAALVAALLTARALGAFQPSTINDELFRALPWLMLMLPVSLIYPILIGALDARRLFGLANANQLAATIAGQAIPLLAVLYLKPTLTVAIAGTIIGRSLSAAILMVFCIRRLDLRRPTFERPIVRSLVSFGGWVALSSGIGLVLDTADRLVIATILGGTAAAWYAIAYNVVTRARALPQAIARTLYPQVSADPVGGAATLTASARFLALLLVPGLAAAMVLIDPLCALWIGRSAADAVVPIARIMMVGIYANCIAYIPLVMLQAMGTPHRVAKAHLWQTPVFLGVMVLAASQFGVMGAAIVWSGRLVADAVILLLLAGLRRILWLDVVVQPTLILFAMAVAWLVPAGWPVQLAIVGSAIAAWAVADTVAARRAKSPMSLPVILGWLRARLAPRPARAGI